jgi:ASCH domain
MNGRSRAGGGSMARGGYGGGSVSGGSRGRGAGRYSNPCLTMHQPWASLLVYGIKRIEGRSWPSPITGLSLSLSLSLTHTHTHTHRKFDFQAPGSFGVLT